MNEDLDQIAISKLKNAHGTILRIPFDGSYIYLRTITRSEAARIGLAEGKIDPEKEDSIFNTAVVWPIDIVGDDSLPAGIVSKASSAVLEASGLSGASGLSKALQKARDRHTVFHSIAATICAAFPRILPSDLDDTPIDRLMDLLITAEEILEINMMVAVGGYNKIEFQDQGVEEEVPSAPKSAAEKDAELKAKMGIG